MPVLAEEAICRATGVKDRQVVATRVLAALTDPIGDAVRRQGITVPMQKAASGCSGKVSQFAVAHHTQSAKAAFLFANNTLIAAQSALDAIDMARWFSWQVKLRARICMNRFDMRTGGRESSAEAIDTDANCR